MKFGYSSAGDILTWTQANSGQTSGNAVRYGFDYDAADQLNVVERGQLLTLDGLDSN